SDLAPRAPRRRRALDRAFPGLPGHAGRPPLSGPAPRSVRRYAGAMFERPSLTTWLVFGGSGAVGRFLLRRLSEAGIAVVALSREPAAVEAAGVRWLRGSLQQAPELDDWLRSGGAPAVICSAGPLDAFVAWLRRSALAPGTRVLALSSLSATWK